jgi:predicted TPR repeat methyltransferase
MDVFGRALTDQLLHAEAETLWLHNSYDEPEEMPLDIFFRTPEEMPEMELIALDLCRGKILDIGAGAGSHALLLQKQNKDVTAMDISPAAVKIMEERGVKKTLLADINQYSSERYDTLLMLMNGIGLTGSLEGFKSFLKHAESLLTEKGQLIFDTSDIAYLYEDIDRPLHYYGQVSYQYEYKGQKSDWFDWLYLDQHTLLSTAAACGWNCEIVFEDEQDQYLARLFPPRS